MRAGSFGLGTPTARRHHASSGTADSRPRRVGVHLARRVCDDRPVAHARRLGVTRITMEENHNGGGQCQQGVEDVKREQVVSLCVRLLACDVRLTPKHNPGPEIARQHSDSQTRNTGSQGRRAKTLSRAVSQSGTQPEREGGRSIAARGAPPFFTLKASVRPCSHRTDVRACVPGMARASTQHRGGPVPCSYKFFCLLCVRT